MCLKFFCKTMGTRVHWGPQEAQRACCWEKYSRFYKLRRLKTFPSFIDENIRKEKYCLFVEFALQKALNLTEVLFLLPQCFKNDTHGWFFESCTFHLILQFVFHVPEAEWCMCEDHWNAKWPQKNEFYLLFNLYVILPIWLKLHSSYQIQNVFAQTYF